VGSWPPNLPFINEPGHGFLLQIWTAAIHRRLFLFEVRRFIAAFVFVLAGQEDKTKGKNKSGDKSPDSKGKPKTKRISRLVTVTAAPSVPGSRMLEQEGPI
jgi:hypothetical protein